MICHISDTHPLVWYLTRNPRLSPTARDAFDDPHTRIIVPTVVLAEIVFLYARGRIPLDLSAALAHIHAATNSILHPLDEAIAKKLPSSLDIHDAIIVATAVMYRDDLGENVAVITRDAQITASGLVPTVW